MKLNKNFGMPYMGSKSKIAKWIIKSLPPAEHFYDLFGGGGAISHCALESGKYKYIHYNELNPLIFKAFNMAINGEFKNENRWISREDFLKLKDTDPYAALCFSFGNNCCRYAFNQEIEPFKKAVHYSIFYNDNSLLSEIINVNDINYTGNNLHNRRIYLQQYLKKYIKKIQRYRIADNSSISQNLQCLESLERLERLQSMERLQRLQTTNLDYRDVKIEDNSVIYCDPPYINTASYLIDFNHNEFYDWCRNQKNVFISEYTMPDDFYVYHSINKKCTFNDHKPKNTVEKLFTLNKMNVYNSSDLEDW